MVKILYEVTKNYYHIKAYKIILKYIKSYKTLLIIFKLTDIIYNMENGAREMTI